MQRGTELERKRGCRGEEERRPCLKRAVEINQYVYVLEEQSVPLAEHHSTVRFPSDCFLPVPFVCVCVCVCVCVSRQAPVPLKMKHVNI